MSAPYQAVIQAALSRWAQVAKITFQQVADSASANIRMGWGSFTGSQVGQTDYSYGQSDNKFVSGVTVRLQDPALSAVAATTSANYSGTTTSLYQVALHEIGHALGLAHNTDPNSVMYATLGRSNLDLDQTDIDGIQALYGASADATITPESTMVTIKAAITAQNAPIQTDSTLPSGQVAVYRFFDTSNGTHFFTASTNEADTIAKTRPDLVAEGASFMEHGTTEAGDTAVYRFFNSNNGTHFFTNSASEQASILSTRQDMHYEGIAFYAPII
ncbi:MAG: matrixin family metalloprotease [Alphaproteobacteria bacterium]|nr:MAG: matrixin family metalloprotease [Alphaproteobacteria bacterium]